MSDAIRFLAALLLCALPAGAASQPQPSAAADPLIGLWSTEIQYGPVLRGALVIRRDGGQWTAAIGNARQAAPVRGDEIRIAFADGLGGFRGRLSPDRRRIEGFWLQPSGETEDRSDPGGSGQRFATPLRLMRSGRDEWRGEVVPLDDRFTLYLKIFQRDDGLAGAFRNPELNSNGGASQFQVARQGDTLRFSVRFDGGEIAHDAALLRNPDRIRLVWPDLGRTIELARRTPAEAASFFPRPPGSPPYAYRRPPMTGDGWSTATAGETGIDEAALTRLVQGIGDSDPAARPPQLIHAILVAHRGRLVLEEYFFGHDRDTVHDIRSAGKTYASVLLGAAMRRGEPLSPDTRIYDLFRPRGPFANPDPRKARITLADLLTHSAGLACDDNDDRSPGNEGTMQSQDAQPDFWRYTLDLPIAHDPGRRYAYCSANINLVGGALTVGSGGWLPQLFDDRIARPLQFGRYHWNLAPNGEGYLGGGAFIRPRDLLKLGQAFLNGGTWNGRRIVDAAWIATSTAPRIAIDEATTGLSAEEFGNYYGRGADALAWHLTPLTVGGRIVHAYAATGNGGQILIVVPQYQLAAVFTGGNYRQGGVWSRWSQRFIGDQIIPAIRPE